MDEFTFTMKTWKSATLHYFSLNLLKFHENVYVLEYKRWLVIVHWINYSFLGERKFANILQLFKLIWTLQRASNSPMQFVVLSYAFKVSETETWRISSCYVGESQDIVYWNIIIMLSCLKKVCSFITLLYFESILCVCFCRCSFCMDWNNKLKVRSRKRFVYERSYYLGSQYFFRGGEE